MTAFVGTVALIRLILRRDRIRIVVWIGTVGLRKRYHPRSVDKPELISTIREAHQRVAGAIEHIPDERLLEPVMDDWTGKDLLAHMAWWHDHSAL